MNDGLHIIVSKEVVMPPEGDIVLDIKFDAQGSPARVFSIAGDLIQALEEFDGAIIDSIDSKITTSFILEDVNKSSLRVVLKNIIKNIDDDALKSLDIKRQIGKFLLKGKYIALEWLDTAPEQSETPRLEDLTGKLRRLAEETDARHLPDYPPPNPKRLAQSLESIQRAKARFIPGEVLVITLGQDDYRVNTEQVWSPIGFIADSKEHELSNELDLVLTIHTVPFIGKSKWRFKHGKRSFSAAIVDEVWLDEFHSGKHALRPNDALRVRARFEYTYDEKGALTDEVVSVIKVYGIIHSLPPQQSML
jgi:hypothetical protein